MKLTGENRSTRWKTCPSATLSTTNPTWTDPGSSPGPRGQRPATNRLSHGTAYLQGYESTNSLIILKINSIRFFQTSGRSNPDDLLPQTQISCFRIGNNLFLSDYFIVLIYCVLLMRDWISTPEWNVKIFSNIWRSISKEHITTVLKKWKWNWNIVQY
jgi:hypothetical protein